MEENAITAEGIIQEARNYKDSLSPSSFPLEIFPQKIKEIIRATNECLNFPIDYIASSLCFAVSVGIGNTHSIRIKESWSERTIMYMAIIGRPGSNKSHPLSFALAPFFQHDTKQAVKFKKEYKDYEEYLQLSRQERKEQDINLPEEPILKKFIVSDITPESLAFIHDNNKRGICLYADELASWFKNFNRYSKGSEEQFWLSRYSGKPIIMDRRGAKSTVSIQHTFINVIGTIQHGILKELAKGERSQNGFMDRILFVLPDFIDKQYWNDKELPKHIITLWNSLISQLINLDYATDQNEEVVPIELCFTTDAQYELIKWQHANVDLCETESDDILLGIYKKLETYISRFCLLVQMMRWICGESDKKAIDIISVNHGILLIEYFRDTARKVQRIINNTSRIENLTSVQKDVWIALPIEFSTGDAANIAVKNGMPERTFKEFLKNNIGNLFTKDKHGVYRKIV